ECDEAAVAADRGPIAVTVRRRPARIPADQCRHLRARRGGGGRGTEQQSDRESHHGGPPLGISARGRICLNRAGVRILPPRRSRMFPPVDGCAAFVSFLAERRTSWTAAVAGWLSGCYRTRWPRCS